MLTLEQIQKELSDRRIDKVSEATGLHYNTVVQIRDKKNTNPSYRVMQALSEYFEQRHQDQ